MKKRILTVGTVLGAVMALTHSTFAAIGPITSVSAGVNGSPPYILESITVGSYTVFRADLQLGLTDALPGGTDGGNFFGTWSPQWQSTSPLGDYDLNSILARNANPNPVRVTDFAYHTLWSDINGAEPDFFIFEAAAGGNVDGDVTVQAILPGDILGQAVALPAGSWGVSGLSRVGNPNNGHALKGISFSVTDLLDASGTPLLQSQQLLGLQINSTGLDPSFVGAVMIPEPATLSLLGLAMGGLLLARRRR